MISKEELLAWAEKRFAEEKEYDEHAIRLVDVPDVLSDGYAIYFGHTVCMGDTVPSATLSYYADYSTINIHTNPNRNASAFWQLLYTAYAMEVLNNE